MGQRAPVGQPIFAIDRDHLRLNNHAHSTIHQVSEFHAPTDDQEFVVPPWDADDTTPFSVIARASSSQEIYEYISPQETRPNPGIDQTASEVGLSPRGGENDVLSHEQERTAQAVRSRWQEDGDAVCILHHISLSCSQTLTTLDHFQWKVRLQASCCVRNVGDHVLVFSLPHRSTLRVSEPRRGH